MAAVREPGIMVERFGGLWAVSVRPCPDELPSMKGFTSSDEAAAYATGLKATYGWTIKPPAFDLRASDKAA
ncbi:hypothetical protein [Sphingomicrobium nitratireducens]|uniref:hypothetical protein n=1 Tax=Sphingomicrobium nitratireducens TaxID=2964666 RepID=UPI00223F7BC5|nr:hypothetical protein [Sphingomicrobium nitratireducens]